MWCIILIKVLFSAFYGLLWCMLVMFFCMCIEQVFFKKEVKPRLTDKEVILIKEVLVGHISLPFAANNRFFAECMERMELLFTKFTDKTEQQINRLESISGHLSPSPETFESLSELVVPDMADELKSDYTLEELLDMHYPETEEERKKRHQELLASSVSVIDMPAIGRNILLEQLCCETVQDILLIMVAYRSRKTMARIPSLGMESIHALELFMVKEGLMTIEKGIYDSEYWDKKKLNGFHDKVNK